MPDSYLEIFFAVTVNSVYRIITCDKDHWPYLEKIAGGNGLPVGTKLNNGPMLAIAKNLQLYYPEGHSMLSPQTSVVRELERVNTMYWGAKTSCIAALFLTKEDALSCFNQSELKPCDQRWINETKNVIEKIGEDHPTVTICHWQDLSLMPAQAT